MYVHYIPLRLTPDRGFCEAVCDRKVSNNFWDCELIMLKNIDKDSISPKITPPREIMFPVAIVLAPQRWSPFRFFGSYAEFGKELFGFVAKPLEHAHTSIFSMKRCFPLGLRSSLASKFLVEYMGQAEITVHQYYKCRRRKQSKTVTLWSPTLTQLGGGSGRNTTTKVEGLSPVFQIYI